jgi:hypothetical protein
MNDRLWVVGGLRKGRFAPLSPFDLLLMVKEPNNLRVTMRDEKREEKRVFEKKEYPDLLLLNGISLEWIAKISVSLATSQDRPQSNLWHFLDDHLDGNQEETPTFEAHFSSTWNIKTFNFISRSPQNKWEW